MQIANGKYEGEVLKLKQDTPTRWNSTFKMLEHFIVLFSIVDSILLSAVDGPEMISSHELQVVKVVVKLLCSLEW